MGLIAVGDPDSSLTVLKAIVEMPSFHATCRGLCETLIGENFFDVERM